MIGTDYPFPWTSTEVDLVLNTPGLSDADRIAILGGTAAKLLGLSGRSDPAVHRVEGRLRAFPALVPIAHVGLLLLQDVGAGAVLGRVVKGLLGDPALLLAVALGDRPHLFLAGLPDLEERGQELALALDARARVCGGQDDHLGVFSQHRGDGRHVDRGVLGVTLAIAAEQTSHALHRALHLAKFEAADPAQTRRLLPLRQEPGARGRRPELMGGVVHLGGPS